MDRKTMIERFIEATRSPTVAGIMVKLIGLYPENQIKGYDGGRWFILRQKDVLKDSPLTATVYYRALSILRDIGYIKTRRHGLQMFCRIVFEALPKG